MRWYFVIALFVIVIAYLCLGAYVFMVLESQHHDDLVAETTAMHNEFLANKTCITESEMTEYMSRILKSYRHNGVTTPDVRSVDTPSPWNYYNSLFFSMAIISTIGYGQQCPMTFDGRLFVVFYAIVGIPLFGFLLIGIAGKIAIPMKRLKRKVFFPRRRRLENGVKTFLIGILGLAVLLCVPAAVFTYLEEWTYGEGFYFAFLTLTTIGLGDYMIGTTEIQYLAVYKILTAVWILVGLVWVAYLVGEATHSTFWGRRYTERRSTTRRVQKGGDSDEEEPGEEIGKTPEAEVESRGEGKNGDVENGDVAKEEINPVEEKEEQKKEVENTKL